MKKINYLTIIKEAAIITWRHKYLWWFGFFLILGSGIGFNFSFSSLGEKIGIQKRYWEQILKENLEISLILIFLFLIIILTIIFLRIISQGGIIKSLDKISNKEKINFVSGLQEGKKYFWKILGIDVLITLFIFALFLTFGIPIVYLFLIKSYFFGIFLISLAIIIFIPIIILILFLLKYSYFYIILSRLNIFQSIERAYQIFKQNFWESIIMGLIFIFGNTLLGLIMLFLFLSLAIIFFLKGLILYFIFSAKGILVAAIIGFIIFCVFGLFINSVYKTFNQAAWFLFFREIASIRKKEVLSTEKELIEAQEKVFNVTKA